MRKHLIALAIVVPLIGGCAPGCSSMGTILSPSASVGEKTLIDEKALSMAYTAAATANIGIKRLAPFMTLEQVQMAQRYKADYDAAIHAAEAAKTAVDAKSYGEKIGAVKATIDKLNTLFETVRS